jgi:glycerophosphoryl diester phosphodiesterase
VDQLWWRATSIFEFKLLRLLSRLYDEPGNEVTVVLSNLASHRGVFSETVVENSKKSIILATQKGFRYIELDVSFSKDHVPFIFHDANLKYKANLDRLTSEVYWEKISTLTLSDSQEILNLREFLRRFAHLFNGVILDVKGDNSFYEEKSNSFCNIIKESNHRKKIYVIGRPCLVLSAIKHLNPELVVGCEDRGVLYNYITGKDLISLHYNSQYSYLEYCLAQRLNLDIILWTVNEKRDLNKLKHLENTIVLTDLHSTN